jgi:hypothetical protein
MPKARKTTQKTLRPNDFRRLEALARALIDRLEDALQPQTLSLGEGNTDGDKRFERLFGARSSVTSTLVSLSELMLKLGQAQAEKKSKKIAKTTEITDGRLSDQDVEIVKEFIRKAAISDNQSI